MNAKMEDKKVYTKNIFQHTSGFTFMEINHHEKIQIQLGKLMESIKIQDNEIFYEEIVPFQYYGYLLDEKELKRLPNGAEINPINGIFTWHPAPEYLGEYKFLFIVKTKAGNTKLKKVIINIIP